MKEVPSHDSVWSAEAGEALHPLIVFVHGAMDRSASMLKLSRRLDDEYRVLRYDRRGYGHSVTHPGPFAMADQVADLVGLLAGRRAVLVGHSYGGNVALAAAAGHGCPLRSGQGRQRPAARPLTDSPHWGVSA